MEEKEKKEGLIVSDFEEMITSPNTSKRKIYTTITDEKLLFNLESECEFKINDCKGRYLKVVDIVIKINEKKLKTPEIDEETGEIIKEYERTIVTILIDSEGLSYVTGSKMFGIQMINYIKMFGLDKIKEGLDIQIVERSVKNSTNKALGFKLL